MKREIEIRVRGAKPLRVPLGQGAPQIVGGLNGWAEVDRPDGRPVTEWDGADALKVDVPIMLDGWPRDSVERQWNRLLRLCRRKDGEAAPPSFRVAGPFFFSGMRMVMAGIDQDPEQTLRAGENWRLVRFAGTLHLMEYVRADQIRIAKRKGKPKFTYTTKKGDSCRSIARDLLGDVNLARRIAKANDIRDVRKVLKPGTVLVFPGDLTEFGPAE